MPRSPGGRSPLKKKALARAARKETTNTQQHNNLWNAMKDSVKKCSCTRCWPEKAEDWHGTAIGALWIAIIVLLCVGFGTMYQWCDLLAGIVSAYTGLLLLRALFQQAATPSSAEELNDRQQTVLSYNKIQQQRWSNFVMLSDDGQTRLDTDPEPDIANRLKMGPFPVPYSIAGVLTFVLATVIYLESFRHELYYMSLTKLTSTLDWFRTLFLLSYGLLAASVLLYMWPTLVYYYKTARAFVAKKRGNKNADASTMGNGGANDNDNDREEALQASEQIQDERSSSMAQPPPPPPEEDAFSVTSTSASRTAKDTYLTTRAAIVLGAISLVLTIYFAVQRGRNVHSFSGALNWKRGGGVLYSFQGDAWVTSFEVVEDRNEWCASQQDVINVKVDVAYGGQWACPNNANTYCETTVDAQVSCLLAPNPLTNDNNNGQQGDAENFVFYNVYDYVNYRYHDGFEDGNDDDGFANFDRDQAPNSIVNGQSVWNRQAEYIVGNCDNCQARSLTYINSRYPVITRALHGFFPSLGSFLLNLAWLGLSFMAKQMRQQGQPANAGGRRGMGY